VDPAEDEILHATAISVAGRGLLILGASGSGKSGLALRMMALGAELVADDRVLLRRAGDALLARPPEALAGLIEARGVGLLSVPHRREAPLALAVDLDADFEARMPHPRTFTRAGVEIGLISGRGVPNLDCALLTKLGCGRTGSAETRGSPHPRKEE
jgi:HPr kinase/phosphorylase